MSVRTLSLLVGAAVTCCASEGQIRDRIAEIEASANAESPLTMLDSRLRLANTLVKVEAKSARRIVWEVLPALRPSVDSATVGYFGLRSVQVLAQLDTEDALRALNYIPVYEPARTDADYKGAAYDELIKRSMSRGPDIAYDLAERGLSSGAFRIDSVLDLLKRATHADLGRAQGLFSRVLAGFPAKTATPRDVLFLLECARIIGSVDSTQFSAALEAALSRVEMSDFGRESPEVIKASFLTTTEPINTEDNGSTLLLHIAYLAKAASPAVYTKFESHFSKWQNQLSKAPVTLGTARPRAITFDRQISAAGSKDQAEERQRLQQLNNQISNATFDVAVTIARSQSEPELRAPLLISLLNRPEIVLSRKRAFLEEAVQAAVRMRPGRTKLDVLNGLMRMAADVKETRLLASITQSVGDTLNGVCKCEKGCESLHARFDCLPLYDIATSELYKRGYRVETLAIKDPALRSRMLLLAFSERIKKDTR